MREKALIASLVLASLAVGAPGAVESGATSHRWSPDRTVWVGNRGFPAVAAFDAVTGAHLLTVALEAPASDVAVGIDDKVYVGEESADQIAVIDGASGAILKRIKTASHPHHLEASHNRRWVTYGAFGTNVVGVIDIRTDRTVEWPASKDPAARTHASVITKNGRVVYTANDVTDEVTAIDVRSGELLYSIPVEHAHELVLTGDQHTLYVSGRGADLLYVLDLRKRLVAAELTVGPAPDTLELVDHGRILTVGLRGNPAQLAVVSTDPLQVIEILTIAGPGTLAGHQWTSPNGRWTYAAFEGPGAGLAIIDHQSHQIDTIPYPGGGRPHGLDVARAGAADS
jgi:DNA-binding beta-propeller fold protein YncE